MMVEILKRGGTIVMTERFYLYDDIEDTKHDL